MNQATHTADASSADDTDRWREAARLRGEHPGWVIIWLTPAGEFRAYRRLPGTRNDTTVASPTASGLGAAMNQAEQDAPPPRSRRGEARP